MKKILISGYYGFGNIGDEAVLGGLLAGLRATLPAVEPVVLSADPAATSQLHQVAAIPRMSRSALRAALADADLLMSGGGSLLQDVTSFRSPLYYLWVLWEAQRAQVPTMVCAQGVGPLCHPLNRLLTKTILNSTCEMTFRDAASLDYVRAIGVSLPPATVTADPSFLLDATPSERLDAWWAANMPSSRPVIGVALRRWSSSDALTRYTAIADALAELADDTGALLLFLPFQYEADLGIAEEMAGWTPAESRVLNLPLTPGEMLEAVSRCDVLLAMRLHALIFAVQQATPAFGVSYDPKVCDFLRAAELPAPLPWDTLQTAELVRALDTVWEDREMLREKARGSATRLRALAQLNFVRIAEILNSSENCSRQHSA